MRASSIMRPWRLMATDTVPVNRATESPIASTRQKRSVMLMAAFTWAHQPPGMLGNPVLVAIRVYLALSAPAVDGLGQQFKNPFAVAGG